MLSDQRVAEKKDPKLAGACGHKVKGLSEESGLPVERTQYVTLHRNCCALKEGYALLRLSSARPCGGDIITERGSAIC
jgi:hypothetical protein